MKYTEKEFDKRDRKMEADIERIKGLVDWAASESNETIDGVWYPVSHQWREVAELALDLANQQEWLDRCEDKLEAGKNEAKQKNSKANCSCTERN